MNRDPIAWARLGSRMRTDRQRQGLTQRELAQRVIDAGGRVSARSITTLEKGEPPKLRDKPPTLEPVTAALGWLPGSAEAVLAGGEPMYAEAEQEAGAPLEPASPQPSRTGVTRADVLELLPRVNEFGRLAAAAGGDPLARDQFERAAQRLVDSVPAEGGKRESYGLAAYRPHGEGESVPEDDQERMLGAMERHH